MTISCISIAVDAARSKFAFIFLAPVTIADASARQAAAGRKKNSMRCRWIVVDIECSEFMAISLVLIAIVDMSARPAAAANKKNSSDAGESRPTLGAANSWSSTW